MREVESKFRVHADYALPPLEGDATGAAEVTEPARSTLMATYHDTQDLRLAREGVTLRYRSGGKDDGWHLKLPVLGADAGTREEIQLPASSNGEVPDRLRELVTVWVRYASLVPVATLRTERTTYALSDADGAPLAEVVDDTVALLRGSHVAARFREIEVEDAGGGADSLARIGQLVRDTGGVGGEFVPKLVRALGPRALASPDPPMPVRVRRRDPARGVVEGLLRTHVRAFMVQDPRIRLGQEDAVHQMRVAARRLRAGLSTFADLLDDEWVVRTSAELRWLGTTLGAARDGEVLLARLQAAMAALPVELVMGPVAARIESSVGGDLTRSVNDALTSLADERYLALVETLVEGAWLPPVTDAADARTDKVVPALVHKAWRRLERRAARLHQGRSPVEDYHRVRIAAKRARYAAEAAVPVFGADAARLARKAERVQDLLGEHHDAVVAADTLRRLATAPRGGNVGFTLGLLHAGQQHAAAEALSRFHDEWPALSRRRYRRWLDT